MSPLLLALLACGEEPQTVDSSADPCDSALPVTWNNWADGFFASYCRACHSVNTQDRYGAPEGVDFDTLEDVQQWEERIRVRTLEEQDMPVGGGVYEEDLALLETWLECGI